MKRGISKLAATAVALAIVAGAFAGPRTLLQRVSVMITSPDIYLDLKLSGAQLGQCSQIAQGHQNAIEAIGKKYEGATGDQNNAFQSDLDKEGEEFGGKLLAILTPAQTARLKQIALQQVGIFALAEDAPARDLGISPAVQAKVVAIQAKVAKAQNSYEDAVSDALAKIPDPENNETAFKAYLAKQEAIRKSMRPQEKVASDAKLAGVNQTLALLTPAQKAKWKTMLGKPFKLAKLATP
jgi:hypothetical protein